MQNLLMEGYEQPEDQSTEEKEEEKYLFRGTTGEVANVLELTVELRSNPSVRILILIDRRYCS